MFVLFRASTNLDLVGCNESEACNHNEMNNFCSKFPIPYHSWLNPIAAQQGSILSLSFYKTDSAITIFLEILQKCLSFTLLYIFVFLQLIAPISLNQLRFFSPQHQVILVNSPYVLLSQIRENIYSE